MKFQRFASCVKLLHSKTKTLIVFIFQTRFISSTNCLNFILNREYKKKGGDEKCFFEKLESFESRFCGAIEQRKSAKLVKNYENRQKFDNQKKDRPTPTRADFNSKSSAIRHPFSRLQHIFSNLVNIGNKCVLSVKTVRFSPLSRVQYRPL